MADSVDGGREVPPADRARVMHALIPRLVGHAPAVFADAQLDDPVPLSSVVRARSMALLERWADPAVRTPKYLAALLHYLARSAPEPLLGFAAYESLLALESDVVRSPAVYAPVAAALAAVPDAAARRSANELLLLLRHTALADGPDAAPRRARALACRYGNTLARPAAESLRTMADFSNVVDLLAGAMLHWKSIDDAVALPEPLYFDVAVAVTVAAADAPLTVSSAVATAPSQVVGTPSSSLSRRLSNLGRDQAQSSSSSSSSSSRPAFNTNEARDKVRATVFDAIEEMIKDYQRLQETVVSTPSAKDLVRIAKAVTVARKSTSELQALVMELRGGAPSATVAVE